MKSNICFCLFLGLIQQVYSSSRNENDLKKMNFKEAQKGSVDKFVIQIKQLVENFQDIKKNGLHDDECIASFFSAKEEY